MSEDLVTFTITGTVTYTLTEAECWPDGAPDGWTLEDLANAVTSEYEDSDSFVTEWGMNDVTDHYITISGMNGDEAIEIFIDGQPTLEVEVEDDEQTP